MAVVICAYCKQPAGTNGLCREHESAALLALFVAHRTARNSEHEQAAARAERKHAERKAS